MTRRPLVAAVAAVGIAAVIAWSVRARRTAPPAAAFPSILLVTVDTLRADRVGAYGGPAGLTPHMDALARRGAVFEEALASVPLTLPSHATILGGLDPPSHGVHDNGTYVFPSDRETLATLLKARGYATGAFVGAYVLDRRFGLARGFDVYDDAIERRGEGTSALESERRGAAVAAAAEDWIARQAGPFFAWAHLYDPHAPYDPPAAHRAEGRPPYDGEVAYADASLGRMVEAARRRAGDSLVIAVLADHGEALGEHGESTHGFFIYQSTLRIPMIIAGPGVEPGTRAGGLARTRDLLPTLLRLAGVEVPSGLDGADVLAGPRARESYAETVYPRTLGWAPLHSYRVGSMKYVEAPRPELYDLAQDPGETRDLAAERPTDAARLAAGLAAVRARERAPARLASDPEVAERLRALGYVAGPTDDTRPAAVLADPKDRVVLWQRFQQATAAEGRGDRAAATAALRALVSEDPGNATFRRTLAAALRRGGAARDAAAALGDLERIAADDPLAWHEAAVSAEAAGHATEALRAARRAIALGPQLPELHNHLGILVSRTGNVGEALAAFDRAIALDPNNARARANRGNALRALGRGREAEEAYSAALRLAPSDADARNGLGVLAVERGDLERAASLFREVLATHPRHHESRLNLAVVLVRAGRVDEARAELRAILASRPEAVTAGRAAAFLRDLS